MTYDVFLSYRHGDREVVAELDNRLRRRGITTWRDDNKLRGGDEWIRRLAGALRHSSTCAVLIGEAGLGGMRDQEIQVAMGLHSEGKLRVFAVLLPGCNVKALQAGRGVLVPRDLPPRRPAGGFR